MVKNATSERENRFGVSSPDPMMLDPSVLTSLDHLTALMKYDGSLYLSRTLHDAVLESPFKTLGEILPFFSWRRTYRSLTRGFTQTLMNMVAKSKKFEAEEYSGLRDEFTPKSISESLELPLPVSKILSDELGFLESHSSLLLRYRKTLTYFKNAGKLVLDFQNRAKDSKSKTLQAIRGPRWILAWALPIGGLALAGPLGAIVGGVGSSIIAFSDP